MGNSVITFEKNRDGYIGFGNLFESELGKYFIFLVIDVVVYFIIAVAIDYASGINFKTIGIRKSNEFVNSLMCKRVNSLIDLHINTFTR